LYPRAVSLQTQTREHLLKDYPQWECQQKILWVEVREETGRGTHHFEIRDLFADERCSQAVLYFLATIDVGRRIPDTAEAETAAVLPTPSSMTSTEEDQ
jgi:hypothetical protein